MNAKTHGLFLVIFIGLLVILWFVMIIMLLSSYPYPLTLPILILLAYLTLWIGKAIRKPIRYPMMILGTMFVGIIGFYFWVDYERAEKAKLATVSTEFEEYDYRPFKESSKIARLDGESSLKITQNYPKIDGSTALYPLYSSFATATYTGSILKDFDVQQDVIQVSKTGTAYERLLNGEVDVIFVPAPSKMHLAAAQAKGVEFKLTPIGKEAFVFFVNKNNPVDNLTVLQIQQIYSGRLKNWRAVGGNDEKIRAFQRPENSGSQTALQKIMGNMPIMKAPREDVALSMGGVVNQVANYYNYDNALGFSFLVYATQQVKNDKIKLLSINGIYPSGDSIRNKTYPFSYEIYAVTLGEERMETQQLIEWIQSKEGQILVEKTGYVPLQ